MANITGKADAALIKADAGTYDTGSNVKALAAGIQGFSAGLKPLLEEAKQFDAKYQQFSDAKPSLENMGNYSDVQLEMIQGEYAGITDEWNNLSRRLARNKNDLEAKNRLAQLTGKIKNLDAGQSALSNIRFGMNKDVLAGDLSDQFTPEAKRHMQQIDMFLEGQQISPVEGRNKLKEGESGPTIPFGDPKIEYVGDNSTLQITMADGTVYGGLNPNNKPIPVPQGSYDAGREALANIGAGILEDSMSSNTLLTGGQAKTKINTKIADLKGNSRENLDLLFTDLTPDDSNVTFADEFAKGGLDKSFYTTDKKFGEDPKMIEYDGKPAFDENGKWQWTEKEAKDFLRESMNQKENMDRFSTYLGNAFADMHNTKVKERRGLANTYFAGPGGDLFADKTTVKAAKSKEYSNMFVDEMMSLLNYENVDHRNLKERFKSQFRNTGITSQIDFTNKQLAIVNPVGGNKSVKERLNEANEFIIGIGGIGDEQIVIDLRNPSDVQKMKSYLARTKYINNMQLGPNPDEWLDFTGNRKLNLIDAQ